MNLLEIPELSVADSTQSEILEIFLQSIRIRGDFPSSLTLLEQVYARIDAGGASSKEIAAMLRVDHLLSLRLIALVNHEHYGAGRSICSVAAAVDHLGLLRVKEVLPSLAEGKNFNAIFLGHAVALSMMQQAILASVIASDLTSALNADQEAADFAYLTSVISNLGPLLLSYYRPQMFSVLTLSCHDNYVDFQKNFKRFCGVSLGVFAERAAKTLRLPNELTALSAAIDRTPWKEIPKISGVKRYKEVLLAVRASNLIAHELCHFTGIQGVQSVLRTLEEDAQIQQPLTESVLETIADVYINHTEKLFLKPVRLPEYLQWFAGETSDKNRTPWMERLPKINQRINPFLYDLRACMKAASKDQEYPLFPQAIFLTLETLVKGLLFDRAVFFRILDDSVLKVGISMGVKIFQPEKFSRVIDNNTESDSPTAQAYHNRLLTFDGTPIFEGEPFVSFPVIWHDRVIGIFYGDKIRKPDLQKLSKQERLSCGALADEWKDIPVNLF